MATGARGKLALNAENKVAFALADTIYPLISLMSAGGTDSVKAAAASALRNLGGGHRCAAKRERD